ncbi:uncharacterized protein [Choristoneura fumiferana]|uniref:uncharacterized protein n=1 Tax=Choristoneura fumiferana TaxID=7141 RepID=UPI003D15B1A7
MAPVDLLKVNSEELAKFLDSFDYVMSDCDGVAAFTDLVAEYTGRTPIGLGKPSKLYGEFAMKRAGVTDASRVLFIGDMIEQDVALGKNVGFKTLLVLTHFTEEKMLAHTIQPDFYAPCLGSLVPILNKHGKKYLCNL